MVPLVIMINTETSEQKGSALNIDFGFGENNSSYAVPIRVKVKEAVRVLEKAVGEMFSAAVSGNFAEVKVITKRDFSHAYYILKKSGNPLAVNFNDIQGKFYSAGTARAFGKEEETTFFLGQAERIMRATGLIR